MHPAFSIIFFTSAAGAGYGLLALLGLMAPFGMLPHDPWFAGLALLLGLALVTGGLLSSLLHLGRPERAWRALSQWRSSWLSREGVASVLTFGPVLAFGLLWLSGRHGPAMIALGLAGALGAILTVVCTGMIYASLKTIRQWHNGWTVPNYLAIGFMSGGVLINALLHLWGAARPGFDLLVLLLVAVALLLKEGYWRFADTRPAPSTPETATGLGGIGKVRFLESPHSEENYLLKEMGYRIGRKHSARLRGIARVLAFGLPLVATALAMLVPAVGTPATVLAALGLAVGVLVERWLFFAEAKHTVQLYYGAPAV